MKIVHSGYRDTVIEVEGTYLSWDIIANKITDGNKAFMDFISDKNGTFTNNSIKDAFNNFSKSDPTNSDALPFMDRLNEKYKDMIVIHLKYMKPEMYKIDVWYTILDKFANFGGNFGIFAEITGCSFLGILNVCILVLKISFSWFLNKIRKH